MKKDIEKMSLKDLIFCLKPSAIKIIIAIFISTLIAAVTTSITISNYFNSNMRELDKQKMELKFEEKQKELMNTCQSNIQELNDKISTLTSKCNTLKEKLELLNAWLEFSHIDKNKFNQDRATKARDKLFEKAK